MLTRVLLGRGDLEAAYPTLVATVSGDRMPLSATDAMARAVPTDVIKGIVSDNCRRSAPTPPAPKGLVDALLERFAPKGD